MKPKNNVRKNIVPLCIGMVLLILCSAGIGTVSAENDVSLGDVYLNALYENLGSLPIAGNADGWTNTITRDSISFTQEDSTHYSITDTASSAASSNLPGTYEKVIGSVRYLINVKYPNVPISGYIYLKSDLSTPIGHLIGTTATTAYAMKLSVPSTLGNCNVAGIALTNPDNTLTRIVGVRNGNTIEFSDSLAEYDQGVWTVTPVFQSGSTNGFSNLAPSYMYGNQEHFMVKSADNTIKLSVGKSSTPVPTPTPKPTVTVTPTASTPEPTTAPKEDNSTNLTNYADEPGQDTVPTSASPAPLIGLIAGLGAAILSRRLRR